LKMVATIPCKPCSADRSPHAGSFKLHRDQRLAGRHHVVRTEYARDLSIVDVLQRLLEGHRWRAGHVIAGFARTGQQPGDNIMTWKCPSPGCSLSGESSEELKAGDGGHAFE
jgi:hypothetical protein